MNDIIFNVLPAQGPIVPLSIPFVGGMPASGFAGSFFGVFLAFLFNYVWNYWNNKRRIFEEEYLIKAELQSIKNDLDAGGKSNPIKPNYGADHVRKYRLFGKYRTQVINWFNGFEKYNSRLEELNKLRNNGEVSGESIAVAFWELRKSEANGMGSILSSCWLKRIPERSDLSRIKFIRYLFGLDALKEKTTIKWWKIWKIMTLSEMLKIGSRILQFWNW